jgi:hypothetical protein
VFGGLVLLDAQEASYVVPLNRAASILGGIAASAALAFGFAVPYPTGWELAGAGLLVASIAILWVGPQLGRARAARAADAVMPRA